MSTVTKNPTFFVDIDGTLVEYRKFSELATAVLTPITEVVDYINEQHKSGAVIIITTARPEIYRNYTINELEKIGVMYHQLVMDCGRGTRVILNDKDPENPELDRAVGINLTRNMGFSTLGGPPLINSYELQS
jgi:hydroxymethylpyrimidine pyrophosphatase-like HAD family hydrolase